MPNATPIRYLVSMLIQLKYMLTRLGLFKTLEVEETAYSEEHQQHSNGNNNYVLMSDGSSPFPVPVSVPIVTASIKKTLPLVPYANFLEQGKDDDDEGQMCCSVCLDCIHGNHKIRELSNCSHVFHRECLDRWLDEGQVTCPLCRSMLLPADTNPWVVLRNAHLLSSEQPQIQTTATPT